MIAFKNYKSAKGVWGSKWLDLQEFYHIFQNVNCWQIIWNARCGALALLLLFPRAVAHTSLYGMN